MIDLARYRISIGSFNAKSKAHQPRPCPPPVGSRNIPSTSSYPAFLAGILYVLLLLVTTLQLLSTPTNKQTTTALDVGLAPLLAHISLLTALAPGHPWLLLLPPVPSITYVSLHSSQLWQPPNPGYTIPTISSKLQNKIAHIMYGNRQEGVKLTHWNAGGKFLEKKMPEIESLVSRLHSSILGISESNLKSSHDLTKVQLPGYQLLTSQTLNNAQLNVSRVVVYVKDELNYKLRPDLMDDSFSSIWIEVKSGRQKFLVANIYRDHQYMNQVTNNSLSMEQQLVRWVVFLEQWSRALATGLEVHTLGDYNICSMNIHQINGEKQCLVDALISRILPYGVSECVRGPTRFPQGAQQHTPAGLDHFWSSAPEKLSDVQVIAQGSSDHAVIHAVRITKEGNLKKSIVRKRDYSKFDEQKFLAEVKSINWMCVYRCVDVNLAVEILTNKLNSILNRPDMAPIKTFQPRDHYAPWLSDETKDIMQQRDRAQAQYNTSLSAHDWEEYRQLRNDVTRTLKNEKTKWMKSKIESCENENNDKMIWKNVLGWLGWKRTNGGPTRLVDPETKELVTTTQKLANIMNQYYVSKVQKIRASLPSIGDPLYTLRRLVARRTSEFSFSAVHPDEVNKIILSLKNTRSSGIDKLETYVIKLVRPYIVPAVTHIINTSLTTLTFPESWKQSKTVPLYKGSGELSCPSSWRPVSLLPILSKCLERCVHNQIVTYMDNNKFLHPSQHAYRSHHSTTTAILTMYDSWVEAVDKGEVVGVALCDMSAAFDIVDTQLLLETCTQFGFKKEAVQWLWSYLTARSQAVYIGGSLSETLPLEVGLPQGSILGPLLYSIFTCAFPEVVHKEDCPLHQNNPPSVHMSTLPPCNNQMSTLPPFSNHMSTPPPSSNHISTPPPSSNHMSTPPPSSNHISTPPPSSNHISTPPPSSNHMSTPPPSSNHISTSPLASSQSVQYTTQCEKCGNISCFADDSCYSVSADSPTALTEKLTQSFATISRSLKEQRLKINESKTHLLVMSTRQKRRHNDTESVHIRAPVTLQVGRFELAPVITPTPVEKLLGVHISQDLSFTQHLSTHKNSIINKLKKRVGALKLLKKVTSFKTRLKIANAVVMSVITYCMPVWAGAPGYLIAALQTVQTEAARVVTGRNWEVPGVRRVRTSELLQQCGWLSVSQLCVYTSLNEVHKVLKNKEPRYLYEKLTGGREATDHHRTRQQYQAVGDHLEDNNKLRIIPARLGTTQSSWRWRAAVQYNALPLQCRQDISHKQFKTQVKQWARDNF